MTRLNIKESMAGRWFMAIQYFDQYRAMLIYLAGRAIIILYRDSSLTVGDITVMVTLLTQNVYACQRPAEHTGRCNQIPGIILPPV